MIFFFSVWVGLIGGIVAIVLGVLAKKKVKETGEKGRGMALAGMILGIIAVVLAVLILVFLAAFFASFLAF